MGKQHLAVAPQTAAHAVPDNALLIPAYQVLERQTALHVQQVKSRLLLVSTTLIAVSNVLLVNFEIQKIMNVKHARLDRGQVQRGRREAALCAQQVALETL